MAGIFQPRIIIGSVVGFIATAIGVIAVFFPSLFNMETKKIDKYETVLKNEQDYNELINFLIDHQNTIVNLNITYPENRRWEMVQNKDGVWVEYEFQDESDKSGKYGHANIDKDGNFFITSEYYIPLNYDNLFRKNGGIGIWFRKNTGNLMDDRSYFIIINKDSDNNKLYKWSFSLKGNREDMTISGNFFVNKIVEDSEYSGEISDMMSPQWIDIMCADGGGDKCYSINVIDLEPLSKKEIESKNY